MTGLTGRGALAGARPIALLCALILLVVLGSIPVALAQPAPDRAQSMPYGLRVAFVAVDNVPPPVEGAGGGGRASSTCPTLIRDALGEAGCRISYCESGWDPNAIGAGGEYLGWFQISVTFHPDATLDPAGNVAAAVRISRGGTDWSAWGVQEVLTTGYCPGGRAYPG